MHTPVSILLADNNNLSEKGPLGYCKENIDFLMPVSKPDLPFDPLPGPGHLAPDEDCLVELVWVGNQSYGESASRPQSESNGWWHFRCFFLNGLPNSAIQSLTVSLFCCFGTRWLTQPV